MGSADGGEKWEELREATSRGERGPRLLLDALILNIDALDAIGLARAS